MTTPTLAMTEIDAVNQMLVSIGQTPVNSITSTGILDVETAKLALDTTLREVQTRGWSFNTDYDYPLTPDGSNNVIIPTNAMWVDPTDTSKDYVIRDSGGTLMFYDRGERTFTITQEVDCNIIWSFAFDELPQAARHYVAMKAARKWQAEVVGSTVLYQFTADQELEALAGLKRLESKTKRTNFVSQGATAGRAYNPPRF
jgi:hypothetical protein